jgi:hypothetical protein
MMASLLLGLTLLWPLLLMLRNPLWLVMEQGALCGPALARCCSTPGG